MATRRYYSANAVDNTVNSAINSTSTTVTLSTSPVGYPGTYPFVVAIDYNSASEELVLVTNASGNTLNITRGYNGTSATAHNAGAVVRHVVIAQDLTDFQDHAAASSGVHGVTGAIVGSNDTQTLTNKTISGSSNTITNLPISTAISGLGTNVATFLGTPTSANLASAVSDETGSGSLVFGTSPTITSASVTGATISSTNLTDSGNTFPTSLATLTGTQTLTNKDLTSATNSFPSNLGNTFTVNAQTGTTYTLVAGDANKLVTATNSGTITVTIPAGVFSVGQSVNITQLGVGQVIFQGDGTSTVYSTPGLKLRAQYSIASVACIATNTFLLVGDLTA